jgi:hypothetical protein
LPFCGGANQGPLGGVTPRPGRDRLRLPLVLRRLLPGPGLSVIYRNRRLASQAIKR